MLRQLSVFIENEIGKLNIVTTTLKENNVNIRAIATFDTPEFGFLRLIVDKPELAKEVLVNNGFIVKITNVLAVCIEDKPGSLDQVFQIIASVRLNINYVYSFVIRDNKSPFIIMHIDDLEIAEKILIQNGVKVGLQEEL